MRKVIEWQGLLSACLRSEDMTTIYGEEALAKLKKTLSRGKGCSIVRPAFFPFRRLQGGRKPSVVR
jgi:hypothetical protein